MQRSPEPSVRRRTPARCPSPATATRHTPQLGGLAPNATLNLPPASHSTAQGTSPSRQVNNVVRKITAATGTIGTVVGHERSGNRRARLWRRWRARHSALLNTPWGVTVDAYGYLYVADTFNHRTARSTSRATSKPLPARGLPTTTETAWQATAAWLNVPYAVAFDAAHNMYIPDSANNRVRVVSPSGIINQFLRILEPSASPGTAEPPRRESSGPRPA